MKTKFNRKLLYIIPIFLVVFVSGCVDGGGGGGSNQGLIIKDFSLSPPGAVSKGEQFFVNIELENSGKQDAKNLRAALSTNSRFLSVQSPQLPTTTLPGVEAGAGTSSVTLPQVTGQVIDEPISTDTQSIPVDLYVSYDYETEVAKTFSVVDAQSIRQTLDSGGSSAVNAESKGGEGPVSLTIQSLDVVKAGPNRQMTVSLKLQNTGPTGGTVTQDMGGGAAARDFLVRLDQFQVLGNTVPTCSVNQPEVKVTRDRPTTVTCSVQLPSDVQFQESGVIKAKITYTYRVQKSLAVSIKGTKVE